MIYADFADDPEFEQLVAFLQGHYPDLQWGQQGENWIWIYQDGLKVEIDNFSALHLQLKNPAGSPSLARQVIAILQSRYSMALWA